jgi:hypothetical protein
LFKQLLGSISFHISRVTAPEQVHFHALHKQYNSVLDLLIKDLNAVCQIFTLDLVSFLFAHFFQVKFISFGRNEISDLFIILNASGWLRQILDDLSDRRVNLSCNNVIK